MDVGHSVDFCIETVIRRSIKIINYNRDFYDMIILHLREKLMASKCFQVRAMSL